MEKYLQDLKSLARSGSFRLSKLIKHKSEKPENNYENKEVEPVETDHPNHMQKDTENGVKDFFKYGISLRSLFKVLLI